MDFTLKSDDYCRAFPVLYPQVDGVRHCIIHFSMKSIMFAVNSGLNSVCFLKVQRGLPLAQPAHQVGAKAGTCRMRSGIRWREMERGKQVGKQVGRT